MVLNNKLKAIVGITNTANNIATVPNKNNIRKDLCEKNLSVRFIINKDQIIDYKNKTVIRVNSFNIVEVVELKSYLESLKGERKYINKLEKFLNNTLIHRMK